MTFSLVRSILFLLIVFAGTALAGQVQEIELTDGSVISGEVLSLTGGTYRIRSGALGTVNIPQSNVRIIRPSGSGHTQSPRRFSNPMSGQLDGMQQTLMGNPDVMQMIQSLQNDPDLQHVLDDPALMDAVRSGNMKALQGDPKFRKLLTNPTIRDIGGKVSK